MSSCRVASGRPQTDATPAGFVDEYLCKPTLWVIGFMNVEIHPCVVFVGEGNELLNAFDTAFLRPVFVRKVANDADGEVTIH